MRRPAWLAELVKCGYLQSNGADAVELLNGMERGVRIDFVGDRSIRRDGPNLPITDVDVAKVDAVIKADVAAGKKAGPLARPPCPWFVVSPIGAVPKKGSAKIRVIHHLSYPFDGDSVNADVLAVKCELGRFADAARAVVRLGRGCHLVKLDVEAAYKQVSVHPDDWHLLGFKWQGHFYYERVLPFGLKSSCRIWEWYATALHRMFESMGIDCVIHYIDDFLFVIKSRTEADGHLERALDLCRRLGIPMSAAKTEGPCTALIFLGILLDTVAMTASLPAEKLAEIRRLAEVWASKSSATAKELQSLAGTLAFACCVVRPGRFFIRSLFARAAQMKAAGADRHSAWSLTADVRADIAWWGTFAPAWNGTSLLLEKEWTEAHRIEFFSDACGSGYGAHYGPHWFEARWTAQNRADAMRAEQESMPYFEMYALVTAAMTWGHEWRGKKIMFRSDCMPVVYAVNGGSSPVPQIMHLLRELARSACLHGYDFRCLHIPGEDNTIADLLSRVGDCAAVQCHDLYRTLGKARDVSPTPRTEPTSPSLH